VNLNEPQISTSGTTIAIAEGKTMVIDIARCRDSTSKSKSH